jgi:rhamnogalacturonyl hydrolase YesR
LGVPTVLLGIAEPGASYLSAAQRQIGHLLTTVPRLLNGAISHREAVPSAWADFVYMVPPILAYYGVHVDDEEQVREAVRQCSAYAEILETECGLWLHIVSLGDRVPGERQRDDEGLWSTSNGWVAAGAARVLATVCSSRFAVQMQKERSLLVKMVENIVRGAIALDTDASGLLRNYLDNTAWWGEVSGTALLAATVFRMASLEPDVFGAKYIFWASQKMETIALCIDAKTGIVSPVVNPLKESQESPSEGVSPEGQAFVVLMYAAWRDWIQTDSTSVQT